jgi:iron complex transport system ATP-binding protein
MLRFDHVSFGFGQRSVLDDVDLAVANGTVATILGPNGAGKSTLLDLCLGWRLPRVGVVEVAGRQLQNMSPRELGRTIGLVPQRENVRFNFSVEDYVLLGRGPHLRALGMPGKEDRRIARDALDTVGMAELRKQSIMTLSGGEYQLMLIARSLTQQPRILLLDEPTSQLDPAHRIDILRVLKQLSERGITVLLTSHSPEIAALVSDEVFLLGSGRICAYGSARSVLTEANLESVYRTEFRITWRNGHPHFMWEL